MMDKSDLERLVDLAIDAMADLYASEHNAARALAQIETLANALFCAWKEMEE